MLKVSAEVCWGQQGSAGFVGPCTVCLRLLESDGVCLGLLESAGVSWGLQGSAGFAEVC